MKNQRYNNIHNSQKKSRNVQHLHQSPQHEHCTKMITRIIRHEHVVSLTTGNKSHLHREDVLGHEHEEVPHLQGPQQRQEIIPIKHKGSCLQRALHFLPAR